MSIATIFLFAFVLIVVVGTAVAVYNDGYRRIPTAPIRRRPEESRWR